MEPHAIACLIGGYLIGSIPFGLLVGRWWKGIDVRHAGSGNVGAANVSRTIGGGAGLLVAFLDITKGLLAVMLAEHCVTGTAIPPLAGLAAILGHMYSPWLGLRGGKGVATTAGVFGALAFSGVAVAFAVFVVVLAWTRYVSAASITAALALPALVYLTDAPRSVFFTSILATLLILTAHRSNLARLFAGSERRFGDRL